LLLELYIEGSSLNNGYCNKLAYEEWQKAKSYFDRCKSFTLPPDAHEKVGRYHRIFLKDQCQSQYWSTDSSPHFIGSEEILSLITCAEHLTSEELLILLKNQVQASVNSHALISKQSHSYTRTYPYPIDEECPYRLTLRGQTELYAQAIEQAIFKKQFLQTQLFSEIELAVNLLKELPDYLSACLDNKEVALEKATTEEANDHIEALYSILPMVILSNLKQYPTSSAPPPSSKYRSSSSTMPHLLALLPPHMTPLPSFKTAMRFQPVLMQAKKITGLVRSLVMK